jgi:hypothetical protein
MPLLQFQYTKPKVVLTFSLEYKGMNLVAPIKELKNSHTRRTKANHVNSVSLIYAL